MFSVTKFIFHFACKFAFENFDSTNRKAKFHHTKTAHTKTDIYKLSNMAVAEIKNSMKCDTFE